MKIFIKILIISTIIFTNLGIVNISMAVDHNVNVDIVQDGTYRNSYLTDFGKGEDGFVQSGTRGAKGIYYTLVNVAHSLKNLMYYLATLFYLIIAIKLLIAENTEEQVGKFKKGIVWITLGLMVMQMAYIFALTLFAKQVGEVLAFDLIDNIINPMIGLLEVLASIFFIAIAIFAFYRMVTANGKEEEITKAKMSILYAIMGFVLIRIAKIIVDGVYGTLDCKAETIAGYDIITTDCIGNAEISELSSTIMQIINWVNGFIGIITVLLIIYAGFTMLFSSGEEEKIKKAKQSLIFIIIGIFLLTINYLILTFFLVPEITI